MKKIYLFIFLACCSSALFSQTLFTYGNAGVDKEEFLRAFNKNKNVVTDYEKSLRDYLELYIKFKLKVTAARDLRLDTLAQLKNDLDNFRGQIEETYLNNEPAVNALIDEAFTRSQKDLHVIHFYTVLDTKMTPEDTLKAYKAMNEVEGQMTKENNDYEKVAKTLSEKYGNIKGSDLGFVTAFSLPYEYENMVYGLKPGETSKAYRSKKGLHIFKLISERKSVGLWKIAQILLAFPPGDQLQNSSFLQKKADSVYQLLIGGGDFAKLALEFSDDKMSYMNGGEMPEFGTGKYELPFETEVFKLTKDGEIGRPFTSQYGYHIIKKISQMPIPPDKTDPAFMSMLKQKVLQDNRVNIAKQIFITDMLKRVGVKKTAAVKDADLFRYADSVTKNINDEVIKKTPIHDKVIFIIGKDNIKGVDWLTFIRDYKTAVELYQGESNEIMLEKFISNAAMDYYRRHLEEYSPDFRYQMDEFRDGNILFEIMERNVWSSAANDSAGLLKYYNQFKTKYKWAASATIIIFNCTTKAIADSASIAIRKGKEWKKVVELQNNGIQADSGRYELPQIPLEKGVTPIPGLITNVVVNPVDGSSSFIKFIALHEADLQRSFEEARGLVINDYQSVLEDKWIADLKKKYPVKINEAVLKSLLK